MVNAVPVTAACITLIELVPTFEIVTVWELMAPMLTVPKFTDVERAFKGDAVEVVG